MIQAFKQGWKVGGQQWKIAGLVYFFQLCLVLTLGLQVMAVLDASIGQSLSLNKLLLNYDHTVFSDFLKVHGASITPLIGELRWTILVYCLFAVFIDAGLLVSTQPDPDRTGNFSFWKGGAAFFFSFVKMWLFFAALAACWTVLIWLPFVMALQPALAQLPSEQYVIWGLFLLLIVYFLGLSGLFLWSVSSRMHKIKSADTVFKSIKEGRRFLAKNSTRSWGLLGMFFLVQLVLVAIYWLFDAYLGMVSPVLIVCMALLQQVFSYCRVLIRLMFYGCFWPLK